MYRICWRSKVTHHEGCGIPMDRPTALAWLHSLRYSWPIEHWLEPVRA